MTKKIQIVTSGDIPLRAATRQQAWEHCWPHRIVQVVIRDTDGNFLLQKRGPHKQLCPNQWTHAATGYVGAGETYQAAAKRELKEEIGLEVPLTRVGKLIMNPAIYGKTLTIFSTVYQGYIAQSTQLKLEKNEVSDAGWFSGEQLAEIILLRPHLVTPALQQTTQMFYKTIFASQ